MIYEIDGEIYDAVVCPTDGTRLPDWLNVPDNIKAKMWKEDIKSNEGDVICWKSSDEVMMMEFDDFKAKAHLVTLRDLAERVNGLEKQYMEMIKRAKGLKK